MQQDLNPTPMRSHLRLLRAVAISAVVFVALPTGPVLAQSGADAEPTRNPAGRELTADQQIRHVLNRLTFGARPGDFERVRAMGVDEWIELQLHPERIRDDSVRSLESSYKSLGKSPQELLRAYPPPQVVRARLRGSANREDSIAVRQAGRMSRGLLTELQSAKVARAVVSERQLQEVMVDFWENHFSVFGGKGPERYYLPSYEQNVIRPNVLGRFRDLLGAVAKSPAMLFYLDNWQSSVEPGRPSLDACGGRECNDSRRRAAIRRRAAMRMDSASTAALESRRPRGLNENYARELMELHTLGVDGGYSQQDVINVARALTGWSLDAPRRGGRFVFRPVMHDAGEKTVLGHRLKAGRGVEDGEEVLDILARHPATARFIATKLVRRFVNDSPPPGLVDRAAATFTRTDGDIREVLRTIFTSPEFFSTQAYRSKVKSPFELVVSALRSVNASPDTTARTAFVIAQLGQPLYQHESPNGYPETSSDWINTGAILGRINFGMAMASGHFPGVQPDRWPFADSISHAPRSAQVDAVVRAILGGEASPDTRRILESGANPLAAAADSSAPVMPGSDAMPGRRNERRDDPAPARRRGMRNPRAPRDLKGLAELVGLALGAPEFQRR